MSHKIPCLYCEETFSDYNSKKDHVFLLHAEKVHKILCVYCNKAIHKCDLAEEACKESFTLNPICTEVNCTLKFELDLYKYKNFDLETDLAKKNLICDTFRICMLSPSMMDGLVKDGTLDLSTSAQMLIRDRSAGWEKCEPDTILIFMTVFEEHFKYFSKLYGEAKRKVSLRADLIDRTKKESGKATEKLAHALAVDKEKKTKAARISLTPFEKAVETNMKMLRCTKDHAVEVAKQMGFKES